MMCIPKNAIWGHKSLAPAPDSTAPRSQTILEVEGFESEEAHLYISPRGERAVLVGGPAHPSFSKSDLAKWVLECFVENRLSQLTAISGPFVALIENPSSGAVTFITDPLGIYPLYVGRSNGKLVFASSVWVLQEKRLIDARVNYDAVASFVALAYNCTNGSIFKGINRLPAGSCTTFGHSEETTARYAVLQWGEELLSVTEAAEKLHSYVLKNLLLLLKNQRQVNLPLSGGFDSRYLLALCRKHTDVVVRPGNVPNVPRERTVAWEVARRLGVRLDVVRIGRAEIDAYDDWFHFSPDGFPISKQASYLVAQMFPGMPSVNGFLGDNIFRGTHDTCFGRYADSFSEPLENVLARRHLSTRWQLYRRKFADAVKERTCGAFAQFTKSCKLASRVFGHFDFYARQRIYISNNFLEHSHLSKPLLPFYDWTLLQLKAGTSERIYGRDIYNYLFRAFFPEIADIPHSDDLKSKGDTKTRVSLLGKHRALRFMTALAAPKFMPILSRKWCMPICVATLAGYLRAERFVFEIERLRLLEDKLRSTAIRFSWDEL